MKQGEKSGGGGGQNHHHLKWLLTIMKSNFSSDHTYTETTSLLVFITPGVIILVEPWASLKNRDVIGLLSGNEFEATASKGLCIVYTVWRLLLRYIPKQSNLRNFKNLALVWWNTNDRWKSAIFWKEKMQWCIEHKIAIIIMVLSIYTEFFICKILYKQLIKPHNTPERQVRIITAILQMEKMRHGG